MSRLIEFEFVPVEDLRSADGNLSWFELSYGYIHFNTDPEPLLVYSDAYLARHQATGDVPAGHSDIQYYIARLWEDVAGALPELFEPVPRSIQTLVAPYLERWRDWQKRTDAYLDRTPEIDQDSEKVARFLELAHGWYRELDAGYLKSPPGIIGWSDETHVHVLWDNGDAVEDGVPVWRASCGRVRIAKDVFFDELKAFHRSFMAGMAGRIDAAGQLRPESGITIDMPALFAEQRDRTALLDMTITRPAVRNGTWDEIEDAVAKVCAADL